MMEPVAVYILAGGKSRRFGSDKARAQLHGEPLILHVRNSLEPFARSFTAVADREDKYADLGLRTIADHTPGLGPVGGLHAALTDLPEDCDRLLLCPCDAAVIRPGWIEQLLHIEVGTNDAIAFREREGRWQPMPAVYARRVLPHVEALLKRPRPRMQDLLDLVHTRPLNIPPNWPARWQINRQEDLRAFSDPNE